MDSKSISFTGVGVQVPASAPTLDREVDELSRALVPVIMHDLANTTQYLVSLNALLADAGVPASVFSGLSESAHETDDMGFVLGMVAFAAGTDVLHDRARRDGLRVLVAFAKRALRREKRDIDTNACALPLVAIDGPDRGRIATWAAARFLFAAARSLAADQELSFTVETRADFVRIRCAVRADAGIEGCARDLAGRHAGYAFESDGVSCGLLLPARSFECPA